MNKYETQNLHLMRNASVPSASLKDMRNVKVSTSSKTNEIGAGLSMILAS
ncbi:MAG: hypothetical protein ACXAEJ_08170 [Candidatus Thorarchaeota archaeon]|jgi:hypothetical protein